MSARPTPTIPYESQSEPQSDRTCGAASLSMVYRSFGKAISQEEIWPRISKQNPLGSLASATYLMAQDALSRGFAALAIQARHPLQVLRLCRENGIRVVLNHRLKPDVPTGHYAVLVDIDAETVVLHDPYFGPSRRLPHAALLELWRPVYPQAEIAGNVLIGIAAESNAMPPCHVCGAAMPPAVKCATCDNVVSLQPAALLGCVTPDCAARTWTHIYCPFCDHTWSLEARSPLAQATDEISGSEEAPLDLNHLFGELDKFRDHVLSLPGVANRPGIRQQLDFINASKDRLSLALTEDLARRRMRHAAVAQLQKKFKQDEEALLKKKEEIQKPASPLDGNALGKALLKNLDLLPDLKFVAASQGTKTQH